MAIGVTLRDSGEVLTDDVTTASVTVATNSLVLVCMGCRDSVGSIPDGAQTRYGVSGLGFTWVRGVEYWYGGNRGAAIFYAMGTGTSGALTITQTGTALGWNYAVIEITGAVTGANGANAISNIVSNGILNNGGQPSITITGTPTAGDVTLGFIQLQDAETGLTEDAGWTRIVQIIGTGEISINVSYSTGQDQSASWSGVRTDARACVALGALIEAVTGGAAPAPTQFEAVTVAEVIAPNLINMPRVFN